MKRKDGRSGRDNSREYHLERERKTTEALTELCQMIRRAGEPTTFAHVATEFQRRNGELAVSSQTLRSNPTYRDIIEKILRTGREREGIGSIPRKNNAKSNAELRQELHSERVRYRKLQADIKILRHQIAQANIATGELQHETPDLQSVEQLEMLRSTMTQFMEELSKLGDFFWDREGFKRANDGKLFLTRKSMLLMGYEPKLIPQNNPAVQP